MSGTRNPQIVLLCAAPGTELSAIANSLKGPIGAESSSPDAASAVHVWDLESRICGHYDQEAGSGGGVNHTMYEVVQKPRHELYDCWKDRYSEILEDIRKLETEQDLAAPATHVVCMHLTWYNSTWKEFFSPVNIRRLADPNFPICHIVVLIDDVYDMFRRLQRPQSLYDNATMQPTERLIRKLSQPLRKHPNGPVHGSRELQPLDVTSAVSDAVPAGSDLEAARIRVQAVERALGELLSWRQAEMVRAETLARTLKCGLTLFATKHTRASLRLLVERPDTPRVYLSHRISEPRRAVILNGPHTNPESADWSPVAPEVNELHHLFAASPTAEDAPSGEEAPAGQVLINPTAIDELRFETDPTTLRRIPRLTPRWPLPTNETLYNPPEDPDDAPDDRTEDRERNPDGDTIQDNAASVEAEVPALPGAHHVNVIAGALPNEDEIAAHVARSLSIHIASEVSFRDHFIVEHTPNLCVFRPFYCEHSTDSEPDWSGGVTEEVNHWSSYLAYAGRRSAPRRIAFVHSHSEIAARLGHILQHNHTAAEFQRQVLTIIQAQIPNYPTPRAHGSSQLSVLGTTDGETVALLNLGKFDSALRAASLMACHFAFSNIERHQAASYLLVEAEDDPCTGKLRNLGSVTRRLNEFYAGGLTENDVIDENQQFFDECDNIFKATHGKSLQVHTLDVAGANTARVRERLGLS